MRSSQIFSKTSKTAPADATSTNHKLLVQGGFVHQELAGVFSYLPLGVRVLNKVENIVREEMNSVGASEMLLSALHPKENWKKTGRWDSFDVLFKLQSQTKNEYALGPTHEEIIIPIAKQLIQSYKDLPRAVYQIQTKFRDELRAKSGIIRGREFRMKDLYSFHASAEDLKDFYEKMKPVYLSVFKRLELDAKIVEASGGAFTKKFSHEFQVASPAGEDEILVCEKCTFARNIEVGQDLEKCPECGSAIHKTKSIEVGNIFDLGEKFSKDFGVTFEDADKKRKNVIVGCYGIGTSRLVGTLVEIHHDERGIVWPASVAPFDVHLLGLDLEDAVVRKEAESLYEMLEKAGLEVLFDDNASERPGSKFASADLIGIPNRLVVSKKTVAQEKIEWKKRSESDAKFVGVSEILSHLK
jgi:prolyl-tRNA synthetase